MGLKTGSAPDTDVLLRLLLEQNKVHALILLDKNGLVVDWLMGAPKMFGYQKEEMFGKNVECLFTPEDRLRQVPQSELELSAKYGKQENDRWLMRKDNVRLWVSGVLICLQDQEGKIAGFGKILRDHTDIKEKLDLQQNRVHALELENRQKTIIMGTLAHELRNPLAALANASELIELAYPQDQNLVPTTQLIKRQVKYLGTLINDLLENVRLSTGKVALQAEPTNMRNLLADVIESGGAVIRGKRQKVELLFPQQSITLHADPVKLKQVFINLLSNASKFSETGATIWVKVLTEDEEVVVRVEDQGQGIPADILPRLFELFSQGEAIDRGHSNIGLGLGLSIVKQYVELHGGSVQARSEGIGRGSEFIVRLPLVRKKD